jgi:hypothetical protein
MALSVNLGAVWTKGGETDSCVQGVVLRGTMSEEDIPAFEETEQKFPPGAYLCISLAGLTSIDAPSLVALAAVRERRGEHCRIVAGGRLTDLSTASARGRRAA